MRLLFLTQVLPYPLDAGPKVRAYYVLRYLAQRHDVTLVSFVRATDTPDALAHLRRFCCRVLTVPMPRGGGRDVLHLLRSLRTDQPFLIARDAVPEMHDLLTQLVMNESFDAVHADQLWMAPYALAAQARSLGRRRPMTVLDQHNAVYLIPQRMREGTGNLVKRRLLDLEAHKLARYEVDTCSRFDRVVWVTAEDVQAVQAADGGDTGDVSGASIKNDGVIPICTDPTAELPIARSDAPRRVTFLGGLHYPPNAEGIVWFAKEVMPLVLEAVPDAVLTVIGKQPPAELGQLLPPERVVCPGYVDDPRPYLADTAAFVVPLHAGGGMRVKILDGWKWGLPMVSTPIGAEGIQVTSGHDMLIAESPSDFAAATIRLLCEPGLGRQLATNGHRTLCRYYDWHTVYQAWDAIYRSDNHH